MKQPHKRKLIISMILSLILLIAGYFINNLPIFTGEDLDQFFLAQKVREFVGKDLELKHSDALFVNVAYDKELVVRPGDGPNGILGNTAITDRFKLYKLLKILNSSQEYKYIIVDLMFDPNEISEADSLLYSMIASMKNIVIVKNPDLPSHADELDQKSALADYFATITATNFVRYRYLSKDNLRSIPLKVYEDLNEGVKFKKSALKYLPVYTSGRRLCYNSCFLAFDSKFFSSTQSKVVQDYYNLGSDLVSNPYLDESDTEARIKTLAKDKYIIIGDFADDLHDTYMGVRPGSLILYRALKTLEDGKHVVKFWQVAYWFVIFSLIFFWILSDIKIINIHPQSLRDSNFIKKLINNKFICFIVSTITYVVILFVASCLEYMVTLNIYSIVLPSYVFMLAKLLQDYNRYRI